jgi:hypothetical protein
MATVVLQYAGAAAGTFLGGPIGGILGRAAGALAGNIIDQKLFGPGNKKIEGPRLNDLRVMASEEGAAIPACFGRVRISGQVIWATNFEEVVDTKTEKASSKGGPKTKSTTYSYFANLAVGLCEGEIDGIGRVWADGKEIDIAAFTTRLYTGTETQTADSLIAAVEGIANTPGYRGLAYIVFERLPLESFGNRLPQLSFEIFRRGNTSADRVRAVTMIPGSTEFGYDTKVVTRSTGPGRTESENAHMSAERSDLEISLDQLGGVARDLDAVSLVVGWFGTDLRCGQCELKPGVEVASKSTEPYAWTVNGLGRSAAHVVSTVDGGPAYGGTPSDASVIRAIRELRARGKKVVFYPFILMDVAQNNALPDPYGGAAQSAYPWRGRITASIAPGRAGTSDKTAAAASQVTSFVGTCLPSHFTASGNTVNYSGPNEWSFRRLILHYAKLCALAGGVDAFLIGSELRGLTTLRDSASHYPFVDALVQLAADVRSILPTAKISYAADWSEYFGHQPTDGSNDVHFHLDAVWSSPNVDFIGIDNYMPLSDWRDGEAHLDYLAARRSIYDLDYLKSQIAGGEGYDYFYLSDANRDAQIRTPITDGAYNKPWVYRYKDIVSWWSNQHFNRPVGVQAATPTGWVPQSKPIWFTEAGCPAADKGTNSPNLFVDPKSSESNIPPYSGGQQDDLIQNRYIEALQSYWEAPGPHNPISSVYGGKMLEPSRIFYWTWDARAFPAFPSLSSVWSDGANYRRGHWLTGRLGAVDLGELIKRISSRFGFADCDVTQVEGLVDGFIIDRPMSAREALENLLQAFSVDAIESEGKLIFRSRKISPVLPLDADKLVDSGVNNPVFSRTRAQETELAHAVRLVYAESSLDYRNAAVEKRRTGSGSHREILVSLPAAVGQHLAQARSDIMLEEAWVARETARFSLPPSMMAIEPGDVLEEENSTRWRISAITETDSRRVEATLFSRAVYEPSEGAARLTEGTAATVLGKAEIIIMDLAAMQGSATAAPWFAAQATPWPGSLAVLRKVGDDSFALNRTIDYQATIGTTLNVLPQGLLYRIDYTHTLDVELHAGAFAFVSEASLLSGGNLIAMGSASDGFEILQFESAELIAAKTYRLTGLLRAQAGSLAEMPPVRSAGASVVLLNPAVVQPDLTLTEAGLPQTWRVGPSRYDASHPSYVELPFDSELKALRPLAPTHLRARPESSGIALSWIRRTRIDGDSWDLSEVPLGEDAEVYKLEILNGASVVRAVTLFAPNYFYTAADLISDFGGPQTTIAFRVAQVSTLTGPGTFQQGSFNV